MIIQTYRSVVGEKEKEEKDAARRARISLDSFAQRRPGEKREEGAAPTIPAHVTKEKNHVVQDPHRLIGKKEGFRGKRERKAMLH